MGSVTENMYIIFAYEILTNCIIVFRFNLVSCFSGYGVSTTSSFFEKKYAPTVSIFCGKVI
jgi:hypothetical protein